MKRTVLIKYLKSNECTIVREGSKHTWWKNDNTNMRSAVPRHSEIVDILANKICKDLGIPKIKS